MEKKEMLAKVISVIPVVTVAPLETEQQYACEFSPMLTQIVRKIIAPDDTLFLVGDVNDNDVFNVDSFQKVKSEGV